MGNYHWYLKQSLDFGSALLKAPVCVLWDPERPLRLHLLTGSWTTVTYDWSWSTDRSPGTDATDNASVAVIDGGEGAHTGGRGQSCGCNVGGFMFLISVSLSDKVLVTTFRQSVVPPPMSSFELQVNSPVNQVTFLCQPQRTNQLAALTSDGRVALYGQGGTTFMKQYFRQLFP